MSSTYKLDRYFWLDSKTVYIQTQLIYSIHFARRFSSSCKAFSHQAHKTNVYKLEKNDPC